MSPIAKMRSTLVRIWPVDGDEAALVDGDTGRVGGDGAAVGHAADRDQDPIEHPRAGACDLHLQPILLGLDLDPRAQEDILVPAADPLGQRLAPDPGRRPDIS